MDKKRIALIKQQFDIVVRSIKDENIEYWFARELMPLLGYERWENFDKAISRAVDSCQSTGIEVSDHFREVTKMVQLGSGSKREGSQWGQIHTIDKMCRIYNRFTIA